MWEWVVKDIVTLGLPVTVTLVTGWYGYTIRKQENARKRLADEASAAAAAATVSTESWTSFIEQQAAWSAKQEQTNDRLTARIAEQDTKILGLHDDMVDMKSALTRAEQRARAAIAFARDIAIWAGRVLGPRTPQIPPPEPPPIIADDLEDVIRRLK